MACGGDLSLNSLTLLKLTNAHTNFLSHLRALFVHYFFFSKCVIKMGFAISVLFIPQISHNLWTFICSQLQWIILICL